MSETNYYVGKVKSIRESDKALLVRVEDEGLWIPKSQIHDDSEVWKEGQEVDFFVSEWFAEQKGWI